MKVINKIAFIVHEPLMYAHYSSVWSHMNKDGFVIVLFARCENVDENDAFGNQRFLDKIKGHGYEIDRYTNIIQRGEKYRYVISNHSMGGSTLLPASPTQKMLAKIKNLVKRAMNILSVLLGGKTKYALTSLDHIQYPPLQIGIKQIRFMYGADIGDGWSLQPWNEMYDLFLCHGPNDENEIIKRFNKKTAIMGYPRYDEYYNAGIDIENIINEFSIDASKKTILWMPTTGLGACSIPYFAEKISGLMKNFNVIVRPHPISFRAEPQYIELLKSLNYKIDSNSIRNMNELYKISDVVLCDFGGTVFSALYLDKNIILLDSPDEKCSSIDNASNYQLFDYVPVIKVDDIHHLNELIADESKLLEWKNKRKNLVDRYFANHRGTSSIKVVEILNNLDKVIG